MPIIQFLLLANVVLICYGQNPRITDDSSVACDLILWIQSLEFQKQCRAVVNCLIFFCGFLQLAFSSRLMFTVSAAFPGATSRSQRMTSFSFLPHSSSSLVTLIFYLLCLIHMQNLYDRQVGENKGLSQNILMYKTSYFILVDNNFQIF